MSAYEDLLRRQREWQQWREETHLRQMQEAWWWEQQQRVPPSEYGADAASPHNAGQLVEFSQISYWYVADKDLAFRHVWPTTGQQDDREDLVAILPAHVSQSIVEHAKEGLPEMVCGILRGRGNCALEAIRARNIAANRLDDYDVHPQTLLLQFAFEEKGDEMMGIYSSRPSGSAYPSSLDAWGMHSPECLYFYCATGLGPEPIIRAFRMQTHYLTDQPTENYIEKFAPELQLPFFILRGRGSEADTYDWRMVSIQEWQVEIK